MSTYYVPVEKDGKWELREWQNGWMPTYNDPDNSGCHPMQEPTGNSYPTLESDAAYWKSKEGVKMTSEEFEVKKVFCHANRDGECSHKDCPQLRDNEPHKSGRSCPLDDGRDPDEYFTKYAVIPGTHGFNYKAPIQSPTTKEQDTIIDMIVTATVGTQGQHDLIQAHMEEYFTRFPSYKDRLNSLEWYHLFLDFYDKITALSLPKQDNGDAWEDVIDECNKKYSETLDHSYLLKKCLDYLKQHYSISKIK